MATKVVPVDPKDQMAALVITAKFLETLAETTGDSLMAMQQLTLLLQLRIHGTLNQQDLHRYTAVEKSANSRNIAKLGPGERPHIEPGPGWVESFEDPANRRTKLVRLTPKGHALMDEVAKAAAQYIPRRP